MARARIAASSPELAVSLEHKTNQQAMLPETLVTINSMQQELPSIPLAAKGAVIWNAEQQQAIKMIGNGESLIIVGSAGTGKTTLVKEGLRILSQQAYMPVFTKANETDSLLMGTSGIIVCSFTKTAVNNIAKAIANAANTATIHKLIEFKPVLYSETDNEGNIVTKRSFEPARNKENLLPAELVTIIIEEAGIVNIRLFNQLLEAIPDYQAVQFIFLGDLFQLDPPYDPAILGYALDCLPVVELTQVYRQALDSPILKFAIDIKNQETWGSQNFAAISKYCDKTDSSLTVKPWKHKIDSFTATKQAAIFIEKEWKAGRYNPETATIILPFGAAANSKEKEAAFGSLNLNRYIADFIGRSRAAVVHEVIAGFNKCYLAVGDHIAYQKVRGVITEIKKNGSYMGKLSPAPASIHLDRWGYNSGGIESADIEEASDSCLAEMDRLLAAASSDNKEALRYASHIVLCTLEDGREIELSSTGDFSFQVFDFSYSQTCYKAQGGEWETVYIFTHKSHAVMLCNEFYYTAVTRARKHLYLICEPDHLMNAVKKQSIAGSNWREKVLHFTTARKREQLMPFTELLGWLGWQKEQTKKINVATNQGE